MPSDDYRLALCSQIPLYQAFIVDFFFSEPMLISKELRIEAGILECLT
jgi:hypothetical protein